MNEKKVVLLHKILVSSDNFLHLIVSKLNKVPGKKPGIFNLYTYEV